MTRSLTAEVVGGVEHARPVRDEVLGFVRDIGGGALRTLAHLPVEVASMLAYRHTPNEALALVPEATIAEQQNPGTEGLQLAS